MSTIVVSDGPGTSGQGSEWLPSWMKPLITIGGIVLAAYVGYKLLSGYLGGSGDSWGTSGTSSSGTTTSTPVGQDTIFDLSVVKAALGDTTAVGGGNTAVLPFGTRQVSPTETGINRALGNFGGFVLANTGYAGQGQLSVMPGSSIQESQNALAKILTSKFIQTPAQQSAWYYTGPFVATVQGGQQASGYNQSNIPVGVKHCPCTDALRKSGVCGARDDWYYC